MKRDNVRSTFYELQAENRRNSVLLVLAFVALFGFLGLGVDVFMLRLDPFGILGSGHFDLPIATLAASGFGMLYALNSWFFGAGQVLLSTRARPADPRGADEKQLRNVVEEMAIAAGLPPPAVYVVPDGDPNAFAVGRDPAHAAIAVTRGLLETLNRDELQGVIAHEMSHVRNLDIRAMTLVTALFGAVTLLSDFTRRGLEFGSGDRSSSRRSGRSGGGGGAMAALFVIWLLVAVLAPLLARLLTFAVSRSREYLADASAAELTRNPLGLAAALRKIAAAAEPTRLVGQGSAHLCITDPRGLRANRSEGFVADLLGTHPPIEKRIAILENMAGVVGSSYSEGG